MNEFLVNSTTLYSQYEPQTTIAGNGNFIVTWTQHGANDSYDIFAQLFDAMGQPIGSEFQVNATSALNQIIPSISANNSGEFIISWSSQLESTGTYEVIAKKFNCDASSAGSEFIVNTYTADAQLASHVALNDSGQAVVVWQSYGQDGDGYGVYGQRYNADGSAAGAEFRINVRTGAEDPIIQGDHQDHARVAIRDDGSFVVTWSSTANVSNNDNASDVYARIYNANGTAATGEFLVNSYTPNAQMYSDVATDASGNFVIALTSGNLNRNGTWIPAQDGSISSVYAQRYNAAGVKIGTEFKVNTYSTDSQRDVKIAMAPTGEFIVAWSSRYQDGSGYGVYAQRYDAGGNTVGGEFRLNEYVAGDQAMPSIAMNGINDFVVSWQSNGQDGDQYGVYARRYFTGVEVEPSSAVKAEGNSGTTSFTFVVSRYGDIGGATTVDYAVTSGSANATDFGGALPSGQVGFAVGETSKTITIEVSADTLLESDETFTLTLSNIVGGTLVGSQAGGTILNDDFNPISGTSGNDTLNGTSLDDSIVGAGGDDLLRGLAGNDILDGGDGIDTADFSLATGPVVVDLRSGTAVGEGQDSLSGIENVIATPFNDTLAGSAAPNSFNGGGGTDTVTYASSLQGVTVNLFTGVNTGGDAEGDVLIGIRNLVGSTFADALSGDNDGNVFDGGAGGDVLNGNGGNDTLFGGDGDDTLSGGAGGDQLNGGTGNNTASYSTSSSAVSVSLLTGTGSGGHAADDILINIQNLIGTAYADNLIGDAGNNILGGGGGDDTLTGGAGGDTINGGSGTDTVSYSGSLQAISINLFTGTAFGGDAEGDTLTAVENLIGSSYADTLAGDSNSNRLDGGAGDDSLSGNGGADSLFGGDGSDMLAGGAGGDLLDGGAGNNTASYTSSTAGISVSLLAGTATGGHAEGDVLVGIQNLTGSAYADSLSGDAGANILIGGAGADTISGGGGIDTASYATSTQAVAVNLFAGTATGGDAEGDVLTGILNLTGSTLADTLSGDNLGNLLDGGGGADALNGNGGADTLLGGGGDDTLSGGAGADLLDGGIGSNTASYASSTAGVTVSLASGTGTGGHAEGDVLVGIQHLTGTSMADWLIGDASANLLSGGSGNDTLSGGAGADTLNGGGGIDTATYDGSSQAVSINLFTGATAGGDAEGDVLTGVENLVGSGFADVLAGDNAGNFFNGGSGDDILSGNGGADTLVGGLGADTLNGGAGSDSFRFLAPTTGQDTVSDFLAGTDIVEFASTGFGGLPIGQLDSSRFTTNSPTNANQRFIFDTASHTLYYDADGSGSGTAASIAVFTNATISASNIFIV